VVVIVIVVVDVVVVVVVVVRSCCSCAFHTHFKRRLKTPVCKVLQRHSIGVLQTNASAL